MSQLIQEISQPMTVHDHIRELQKRVIVSILSLAIAGFIVYLWYDKILAFLASPLGAPLYYNTPAGSFTLVMKICFTGALIITTPIIVYNLIMFVQPAYKEILTRKNVLKTTAISTILAISGAIFAFYCILPGTLDFLKGFQVSGLNALISADSYLGFVTNIIIMFVIVFQIPLLIGFIDRIKPLKPIKLLKMEKWVILGSLMIAVLAPFTYDFVTSLLIAVPIIVLFNLSIVMVVVRHIQVERRVRIARFATITKPEGDKVMILTEMFLNDMIDELSELDQISTPSPILTQINRETSMDIKSHVQTNKVEPPAWVLEKKRRFEMINLQNRNRKLIAL